MPAPTSFLCFFLTLNIIVKTLFSGAMGMVRASPKRSEGRREGDGTVPMA